MLFSSSDAQSGRMRRALRTGSGVAMLAASAVYLGAQAFVTAASPESRSCPPLRLCKNIVDKLDVLIPSQLEKFDVPGAAVALIQDGEVIYSKGFGVRNRETGQPFTPDTVYRIGSCSKSMTSMLAATEVDAGLFDWDTKVESIRPDFRLPTEELTQNTRVRDLMSMGTGLGDVPEVYADQESPRHLWQTLRNLPLIAPPHTKFIYNSTVYSIGGYLGALASGVPISQMLVYYQSALKTRIFDRIGMPTSAATDWPQYLSNNFAVSYTYDLVDGVAPRRPLAFQPIRAIAPAGSVATTLSDMSRYVITQLQKGVAPNGTRIVSAQNLEQTWRPQTKINGAHDGLLSLTSYGLGWFQAKFQTNALELHVLTHSGAIDSFSTEMAIIPDSGIGILTFSTTLSGYYLAGGIRDWVLQSITRVPATAFEQQAQAYATHKAYVQSLRDSVLSFKADCNLVGEFAGIYEQGWRVEYDLDDNLWLTRGDYYRSPLLRTERGYLVGSSDFGGSAWYVTFERDENGTRHMRLESIASGASQGDLVAFVAQTEAQPVMCSKAATQ
jgi:CubicO group peptidase (beta-lactamase class C family)